MFNEFSRHEERFHQWCVEGYTGAKEETLDFIQHLSDPLDDRSPRSGTLWPHQFDALLRTIYSYEVERKALALPDGVLLNIVTGGGKTALIAAIMVWLRLAHRVQRFLIVGPNLIVKDRLEEDFAGGKVFVDRDLIPPDKIVTKDDFALTVLGSRHGRGWANMLGANVFLCNIHQLYKTNNAGLTNMAELMNSSDFAIFNDEAHNSPAEHWHEALDEMRPKVILRVDTTATPDRADGKTPDSNMIYEYSIHDALADRLVKSPVVYQPNINTVELTYRDAVTGETRGVEEIDWDEVDKANLSATQWVTDDKPMRQQMAIALARRDEQVRRANGRYNPVLFVVAVSKLDAQQAQRTLQEHFNVNTLLVTEDSSEDDRRKATQLGRVRPSGGARRYDAVVSVLMLREGWDVPEVGVILLLRKFSSKVYGQQVIGRGLRRVRLPSVNEDEPQICAVVDHPKLEHQWLWDIFGSKVRKDVGIDEQFDEDEDLPDPPEKQRIEDPSLIIDIPEENPLDDEEFHYDGPLEELKALTDWRDVLEGIQYATVTTEITDQDIDATVATELTGDGWKTHTSAPELESIPGNGAVDISREDLEEHIKSEIKSMAENLLNVRGYSISFQGRIYSIILDHVKTKFLDGTSIGLADDAQLATARRMLERVELSIADTPGLIEGMVEHGD